MKKLLLVLWQLPQILVFWVLFIYYKVFYGIEEVKTVEGVRHFYSKGMPSGMSLNGYILLNTNYLYSNKSINRYNPVKIYYTLLHEEGHSIQSRRWGWLYLPVFGIPSLIHNIVYRTFGRKWDYYSFYTEKNANKLAGISRKDRQWL